MPEKLIPVSKRQADLLDSLTKGIKAGQEQLQTVANTILMGHPEEIPKCGIVGVREDDGDHFLVVELPDIAPPAEVKSA